MILLLGGTAETALLATQLARAGYKVLVSTATGTALATGNHPLITRRTGALDEDGLARLLRQHPVRAVVDATHPYAAAVRLNARRAAEGLGIPYFTYIRPPAIRAGEGIAVAPDHPEAARLAFSHGRPVLLTTGSRNLAPYGAAARQTGIPLVVRVLDTPDSLRACRTSGIPERNIVTGRGPFSLAQNREIIGRFAIGVVVTKDGGTRGGAEAKLAAARQEGCVLVVISRPAAPEKNVFADPEMLLAALIARVPPAGC